MIAGIAQVVLLCLAGFGYFYTVRPVYQNERLSEENARLGRLNDSLRKSDEIITQKMASANMKLDTLTKDKNTLTSEISSLEIQRAASTADLNQAEAYAIISTFILSATSANIAAEVRQGSVFNQFMQPNPFSSDADAIRAAQRYLIDSYETVRQTVVDYFNAGVPSFPAANKNLPRNIERDMLAILDTYKQTASISKNSYTVAEQAVLSFRHGKSTSTAVLATLDRIQKPVPAIPKLTQDIVEALKRKIDAAPNNMPW